MHPSYVLAWALPIVAAESCISVIAKTHTFTSIVTTVQFTTLPNESCAKSTPTTAVIPAGDALLSTTQVVPIPTQDARPEEPDSQPIVPGGPSSLGQSVEPCSSSGVPAPPLGPVIITTAITPSAVRPVPTNGPVDGGLVNPVPSDVNPPIVPTDVPTIITTAITPSLVRPKPSDEPAIITTAITPSLIYPRPSDVPEAKPPSGPGAGVPGLPDSGTTITTIIKPSAVKPVPTKPSTNVELPLMTSVEPAETATGVSPTITTAITPSIVKVIPAQSVVRVLPFQNVAF
ncbi:hypothetical protein HJFPF1_05706 [Paramyrothecium foliicola]|nr:hypothetical protein HJFPF1_05706 [Paramyrothecium foliicola]